MPAIAHHKGANLPRERLMPVDAVLKEAAAAKANGAHRFCMGAAWRKPKDGPEFDAVLEMVRGVRGLGMEACVTLGMLTRAGAAPRGGRAHLLQSQPRHRPRILRRHHLDPHLRGRLQTLEHVREAGIGVCCGWHRRHGRAGARRAEMLQVLANHAPHPESVPINALVAVEGTPLEDARRSIARPRADVRHRPHRHAASARASQRRAQGLTREAQILCFLAGANSIFYGERLLTTANNEADADAELLRDIGVPVPGP